MSDKKLKTTSRLVLCVSLMLFIWIVQLVGVVQPQKQEVAANDLLQITAAVTRTKTEESPTHKLLHVTPISIISTYEHCILAENDADPVNQYFAGTLVPFEPVLSGVGKTEIQKIDINLAQVGIFDNNNFHVVIVPVDYSENQIGQVEQFSRDLLNIFEGVNVDFSYVEQSIAIGIEHIDRFAQFMDWEEIDALVENIRDIQEADAIIFGINTDLYIGGNFGTYNIAALSSPDVFYLLTHELAHSLGLGDGYRRFYIEDVIPSSELFYINHVSSGMETALNQLETLPPLYEAGTCNGRKIYTFYESGSNIMGNYDFADPNSREKSVFTPLQIIIMNNYIEKIKNK